MSTDYRTFALASELVKAARAAGLTLATAESCTGGLVAGAITGAPGSSEVFPGAIVSYSNAVKCARLGVPAVIIDRHGAVSEETARAMLAGLFQAIPADLGVAITGIAGPGGGTAEKPVGLVHFAVGLRDGEPRTDIGRYGDIGREAVRLKSVENALGLMLETIQSGDPS